MVKGILNHYSGFAFETSVSCLCVSLDMAAHTAGDRSSRRAQRQGRLEMLLRVGIPNSP